MGLILNFLLKCHKLDNYLDKNPFPNLKVIKIDLEGFGKEVLIGARNALEKTQNLILFIDIHPGHGIIHKETYNILQFHGFSLYKRIPPYSIPVENNNLLSIAAIKEA